MTPLLVSQNVVNVYAEPDSASDLGTQALLNDRVETQEERDGFCRVTTEDRYGGWIAQGLLVTPPDDSDYATTTISTLFADVFTAPDPRSEMLTKLVAGTRVVLDRRAGVGDWVPLLFPGGQAGYVHSVSLDLTQRNPPEIERQALQGAVSSADLHAALGRLAAETAKRLVGTPYLWGGTTPFGLDCSGLTQLAYKLTGVQLLRDAYLQLRDRRFGPVEEGQSLETALLEDGDLVFFSRRDDKRPTHVGLALGDGRFVHARGGRGVRIDDCDSDEYGTTYVGTVRLSADADLAIQAA